MLARALEQVHAELLTAEPSTAPGVDQGQGIRGEEREVAPDEGRLGDHVRAGQRRVESLRGRRLVVARRRRVQAHRT